MKKILVKKKKNPFRHCYKKKLIINSNINFKIIRLNKVNKM